MQLPQHRGCKLDCGTGAFFGGFCQRHILGAGYQRAAPSCGIEGIPIDGIEVVDEHLFAADMVYLQPVPEFGEFVDALPEFCVVGKVEAVPHDVQQQMGDTHDEIVVLVRPIAGEQVVGDGGGAQAEHRILFGSEVVEEGAGRDSGFRRDVFDGAAAHAVLAG